MNFKLHIFKNNQLAQTFMVQEGQKLSIGRQGSGAIIGLADEKVSRQHAEIFVQNDKLYVRDVGSSNGTYVGQTRLDERPCPLAHDYVVWFSRTYYIKIEAIQTPVSLPPLPTHQYMPENYQQTIEEQEDQINQEYESQEQPTAIPTSNTGKKIMIGVGALFLAFGLFYFTFLGEYLAYQKVVDAQTKEECQRYYNNYSDGRHIEDVRFIEIDNEPEITRVRSFIGEFPNSTYFSRTVQIRDKLWEAEIERYEKQAASKKSSKKSVEFFRQLLLHLKNQNQDKVYVKYNGKTQLKDYEEYPKNIRNTMETFYLDTKLPMLPLKENFTSTQELEYIITNGIGSSFSKIFTEGFVEVEEYPYADNVIDKDSMIINIDYMIKNQVDKSSPQYPNIWTYTKNDISTANLLGIDIDFVFDSKVPNTSVSYFFKTHSEPAESISGIEDIKDGYKMMSKSVFEKYADEVTERFGLEGTYKEKAKQNKQ